MSSKAKVVVAMSGGVDSSLAAWALKEAGFEVFGVSMELYSCDKPLGAGCCTPKDRLDARRVSEKIGIPFEILDLRPLFRTHVMEYFAEEYSKGRTPLPCAPCNSQVRFKALLDYADSKNAWWIATGHYARVQENGDGSFSLLRGKDRKKDQSYFLWGLEKEVIARLKLPIGGWTKDEVRDLARKSGLATAEKEESQDLCFVGDEDHARFLEEHFPTAAYPRGDFVNEEGKFLGKHHGVHAYTVGQRKRLGVSLGARQYVLRLDPEKNRVVLGSKEALKARGLIAKNPNWFFKLSAVSCQLLAVKIRSTHPGVPAQIEEQDNELKVTFQSPQEAVTPGQAAVFYDGDRLLGGAWIERAVA